MFSLSNQNQRCYVTKALLVFSIRFPYTLQYIGTLHNSNKFLSLQKQGFNGHLFQLWALVFILIVLIQGVCQIRELTFIP